MEVQEALLPLNRRGGLLPQSPLVSCHTCGSLTACGGCAHRATGELFKFYLKSSVCQRQTGLPKGNPPCAFPAVPAGVIGRREGARIQWMQLPKAASDWQPSTETRIWHGSAKDDD